MISSEYVVKDIAKSLQSRLYPTIKMWNRLEGRPQSNNFDRALKAEVRDALWMLTKQWQMGEFTGDDAGAPVLAKVQIETSGITEFTPGNHASRSFNPDIPLEAQVEQHVIPLGTANRLANLNIRLQMGRQWLQMLAQKINDPLKTMRKEFINKYGFSLPANDASGDYIYAHLEAWQMIAAVSGRCMDGALLYKYLKGDPASRKASDGISGADATVDALGIEWMAWFEALYLQPDNEEDAWKPSQLEYQCAVAAPELSKANVLVAEEYYQGQLDWYSFDIDPSGKMPDAKVFPPINKKLTQTFLPSQVSFDGMPNTRWWSFEDSKASFGDVKPATTDLAKLLLIEFGLIYANDWFLLPFTVPTGTLCRIKGLMVVNTFGERFWINAAGHGYDDDWQRWAMFNISKKGQPAWQTSDDALVMLPVVSKIQESNPLEEVSLIRDEMSNMVWAIETKVPLVSGTIKRGKEMAIDTISYYKKIFPEPPAIVAPEPKSETKTIYQATTTVPENWIPFIPVKVDVPGNTREIQLQRGAMLRHNLSAVNPADQHQKVTPRTYLVRNGLDESIPQPYFIHEEEVPRSGITVTRSFQRTRWNNGEVYVWMGSRKQAGRGEGSSGLAFDQLVEK